MTKMFLPWCSLAMQMPWGTPNGLACVLLAGFPWSQGAWDQLQPWLRICC